VPNDFLSILDFTSDELQELFLIADALKNEPYYRPLSGKSAALIFQKPSLRTRVTFEVGVSELGGTSVVLSNEGIGIGTRETAADIARLLDRTCRLIVARVYGHHILEELAVHARVPVINALSDYSHPCQIVADLYTIRQHRRLRPGVKIAFIGDGNNVVHSWIESAMRYPMHFVLAAPEGFDPDPALVAKAAAAPVGTVEIVRDPREAVRNADVVYTDVWTSMGHEAERERRLTSFAGFQVNQALMSLARPDAIVMHCLPAHRGEEITAEVLDGPQSVVFDQAENRLHAQKAVMAKLLGFRL
jgi:ornithine carbamoyltransferase